MQQQSGAAPAPDLEGVIDRDQQEVAALDRLERRVIETVDQLRDARRRLAKAEEHAQALQKELSERDREISRLTATQEESEKSRRTVRTRLENLLERLDSVEDEPRTT